MFERRLKLFLAILFVATLVLLARAMQLQVLGREQWRELAAESMKRSQMLETTRGRILDHKGRPMAVDKPCIDACVDFRAIPPAPDAKWVREIARRRLLGQPRSEYRSAKADRRNQLLDHEIAMVNLDIQKMWAHLAEVSGRGAEEIDAIRQSIMHKVKMRKRYIWYQRFEQARRGHQQRDPSPWYQRWLIADDDTPELDQFEIEVAEETDAHVILRAIPADLHNQLGKNLHRYPGLVLRASTHRFYPYGSSAAHLLGRLSRVMREDLQSDAHVGNELRAYQPNDLTGRTGLEALCEPLLRGQRGLIQRSLGDSDAGRVLSTRQPVPGIDVECSIDIELQSDVEQLFDSITLGPADKTWSDTLRMPGAAVVIDVRTGEVRAMVSKPSFDPNQFDELYDKLAKDDVERPLMNRATQFQLEPGSTVKPIVGLAAITQGVAKVTEPIECTGFLVIDGKVKRTMARCWVASSFFEQLGGNVAHHPVPYHAPHPTGFLDVTDALERSCNVYFETLGHRLGVDGISYWFDRFGLGRPTGVGIPEVDGRLPSDLPVSARQPATAWFASIGQDQILATPLQMANVAATIARDGMWMRPRLVHAGTEVASNADREPTTQPIPERVDLKLDSAALAATKNGMFASVNGPAGTGKLARHQSVAVAGKTGTAQAQLLSIPDRDAAGNVRTDGKGRPIRKFLEPIGTRTAPHPLAPWYRASGAKENGRNHAWFVGYAPAEDPQIAFAVLIEYGGSGGTAAALTQKMLDACIKHGYLRPSGHVVTAEPSTAHEND